MWNTRGIWKIYLLAAKIFYKSKTILTNEIYVYKKFKNHHEILLNSI